MRGNVVVECLHMEVFVAEILDRHKEFEKLKREKRLTKSALCDLARPFRDKYHLKDSKALHLIMDDISLSEAYNFYKEVKCHV